MLLELPFLSKRGCCELLLAAAEAELPTDDTEGLRRIVRFVWTSATLVGVCGRARSAAAAAADDKALFGFWLPDAIKAAAAAVEALGLVVLLVTCGVGCCRLRLREFPNMLGVCNDRSQRLSSLSLLFWDFCELGRLEPVRTIIRCSFAAYESHCGLTCPMGAMG